MNWQEYYQGDEWERESGIAGAEAMAAMASRFIEQVDPADFASIGCGPAATELELAEMHPDVEFYGFDLSDAIIEDNERVAADRALENIHFAVDELPELDTDQRFDVVYAVGMLYWLEDIAAAIQNLYDHVTDGGHLIVNYPNLYLHYEVVNELPAEKRDNAPLVRDAENLLTFDRVGEILGTKPKSYYNLVEGQEHRTLKWPIVVVRK